MADYSRQENIRAIVLDMPLLLEVAWDKHCDVLIFVECSDSIRSKRAEKRDICYENRLKKREKFQISLDNKAQIAHYTVRNNSDLSALAEQVERIFSIIMSG